MTNLNFPSNPKKRVRDFEVPLGDVLSREGKKPYGHAAMLEQLKARLAKAAFWLLVVIALWIMGSVFVDHMHGNGKQHRKETRATRMSAWARANGYPDIFQTLCFK